MVGLGPIERGLIYLPVRQLVATPAARELTYEDVRFTTADGVQLHGWFVPGPGPATLLWTHGNAGNISHRVDNIAGLHRNVGANVFIFDYRGYGSSGGSPSEHGTYLDAEAALEALRGRPDVDPEQVVYFGRSLGAAVAVELALRHSPRGLILEGAFTSVPEMARHAYPFLPVWPLLQTRYDSLSKLGRIQVPVLVIHAERDEVVPFEMGRRLFEAAREPKRFFPVRGAHHNDTFIVGGDDYYAAIRTFLQGL